MVKINQIYQLKVINELLAQIGKPDIEQVENVRKAMLCIENEASDKHIFDKQENTLFQGIDRLLELYFGPPQNRDIGVHHWHIPATEVPEYLWMRMKLNQGMLHLSGFEKAIFIVTGIRKVIHQKDRYWTQKHQDAFSDLKNWIESYILKKSSEKQNLNLLIF